jgi:SAM-dependent methyltransferase
MNYAELYNRQYAHGSMAGAKVPFARLRRLLAPFQVDLTVEQLASRLLPAGGIFLDAGCGEGALCFVLQESYERVIGLDVAPVRLARAREKARAAANASKFSFVEADLDRPLPVADSSVDVLCCLNVIEHVFDVHSLVADFHRILKPGAFALFQVPNIGYFKHRVRLLFGNLPVTSSPHNWPEIGWDGGHLHYFTMNAFCGLLHHAGLEIVRRTGTGLLGSCRNWRPALLTGDLVVLARKGMREPHSNAGRP